MALSTQDAEGLVIKAIPVVFKEKRQPTTHIRGFFAPKVYDTMAIPIAVVRDLDYAAVDVVRGTNGNMNKSSVWSEKEIVPPEYHEVFSLNTLRNYERAMGMMATTTTAGVRAALAMEASDMLVSMQNKIIRAEELQCVQALETGVITLNDGSTIDYKRKSGSLVDNSTSPWTNASTDIEGQLQDAANFIRQSGASNANTFDITMSGNAWIKMKKSNFLKEVANFVQVRLIDIGSPQGRNGAAFHGQIIAGAYIFNVWTYDATYLNASGVRTRLTDETKVIITPTEGAYFELAYGATDSIVKSTGATSVSGLQVAKVAADYYVWDNVDLNNRTHSMHIASSPVARLVTVDQVYTMKIATSFTNPVVG